MNVLVCINEIGFMDDFVANIKESSVNEAERKLQEAHEIAIESPDSGFSLTALSEVTKDGVAKEFTFKSMQTEESLTMIYIGVADAA